MSTLIPIKKGNYEPSEQVKYELALQRGFFYLRKGVLGIAATQSVAIRYLIPRPRWRRVGMLETKTPHITSCLTWND